MLHWLKRAREAVHEHGGGVHAARGCEQGHHHRRGHRHGHCGGFFEGHDRQRSAGGGEDGGHFGVRRPLRFLTHKLDLSEAQVKELARILNALKTERAQAEVDELRTLNCFADALAAENFDSQRTGEGCSLRMESAERLKKAVETALAAVHALLTPAQRDKLAYLLRTGTVLI